MAGIQRTLAELQDQLEDQLYFLEVSALAYDQGQDREAKRLATALRVLVYDTDRPSRKSRRLGPASQTVPAISTLASILSIVKSFPHCHPTDRYRWNAMSSHSGSVVASMRWRNGWRLSTLELLNRGRSLAISLQRLMNGGAHHDY